MWKVLFVSIAMLMAAVGAACDQAEPTATPTPTVTQTAKPKPTPTSIPTPTTASLPPDVEIGTLISDYISNSIAADQTYRGQSILLEFPVVTSHRVV